MGFEKFGRKSFTSQTKAEPFVEYLQNGEIRGTKCKSCGKEYFPPRADCAGCLGSDMEWFNIDGEGRLISFTRAGYAPTGFEADVPYTLALADFNGTKVFGRLGRSVEVEKLAVGASLKLAVNTLENGQLIYEFLPNE